MSQVSASTCQAKSGLRSLITMHYTTTGAIQECSLPRKIPYFPCFARKTHNGTRSRLRRSFYSNRLGNTKHINSKISLLIQVTYLISTHSNKHHKQTCPRLTGGPF